MVDTRGGCGIRRSKSGDDSSECYIWGKTRRAMLKWIRHCCELVHGDPVGRPCKMGPDDEMPVRSSRLTCRQSRSRILSDYCSRSLFQLAVS